MKTLRYHLVEKAVHATVPLVEAFLWGTIGYMALHPAAFPSWPGGGRSGAGAAVGPGPDTLRRRSS